MGKQLNTIVDLVVNLSEHLSEADTEIVDLLKRVGKKGAVDVPIQLLEKVNSIHKNQDYLQVQVNTLLERVNKTLNKADKFPSKKDIRAFTEEIKEVVKVPNSIETKILELASRQEALLKKQAEDDAANLRKILLSIERFRLTYIGEDPETASYNLEI